MVFVDQIVIHFISDQALVFFLQVFTNLLLLCHVLFVLWVSEVVLLFRNEFNTHFVNFILFKESSFVCGEIVLNWRIVLAPPKNFIHRWVQMSQILLFSVKFIIIIELIKLIAENLMLNLSFFNFLMRFTGVPEGFLSESITMHDFCNLVCLLMPSFKLVTSLFGVRL